MKGVDHSTNTRYVCDGFAKSFHILNNNIRLLFTWCQTNSTLLSAHERLHVLWYLPDHSCTPGCQPAADLDLAGHLTFQQAQLPAAPQAGIWTPDLFCRGLRPPYTIGARHDT